MAPAAAREFFDFEAYDGTPGEQWEQFDERVMNYGTSQTDDRGWSLADCFQGVDEGGPLGPGMPVAPAELRKANAARQKRLRMSYGMIVKHITDPDHVTEMKMSHFQNGPAAYQYLVGACALPVNAMRLRDLNKMWDSLDILADVGVDENSILQIVKKIKVMNSRRPLQHTARLKLKCAKSYSS